MHLVTLVQEAEQRVSELQAQVRSEGPCEREGSDRERQLKAWEWRLRLFRRMQTGFEHAGKAFFIVEQLRAKLPLRSYEQSSWV